MNQIATIDHAKEDFQWTIHRLRHASGKKHLLDRRLKSREEFLASRYRLRIAASCIAVAVLSASLILSATFLPSGIADRIFLPIAGLILQAGFLVQILPAFAAYDTATRRQQLTLPLPTKVISRNLFNLKATVERTAAIGLLLLAAIVLASGVAWSDVLINGAWQMAVLLVASRLAMIVISKAGYHGWLTTILFWLFFAATPFALAAVDSPASSVFFQPLIWPLLRIPSGIEAQFGVETASVFVCFAVGLAWSIRRVPFRRIQCVAKALRNLPDREDPTLGNINYVHPHPQDPADAGHHRKVWPHESLTSELFRCRDQFDPSGNLPPGKWRWIYAAAVITYLIALSITISVSYLRHSMGSPQELGFARCCFLVHMPNMIAVMAAVPSLRSRIVTQRSLMRMATSGLPRDLMLTVGLLIPATVFTASYQDKWPEAFQHAAVWLVMGVAIRFAWIPFTGLVSEFETLSIAWGVCGMGLVGMLPLILLARWLHFSQPQTLFVYPVIVGVILAIAGWDRVLALVGKLRIRRSAGVHR